MVGGSAVWVFPPLSEKADCPIRLSVEKLEKLKNVPSWAWQ